MPTNECAKKERKPTLSENGSNPVRAGSGGTKYSGHCTHRFSLQSSSSPAWMPDGFSGPPNCPCSYTQSVPERFKINADF